MPSGFYKHKSNQGFKKGHPFGKRFVDGCPSWNKGKKGLQPWQDISGLTKKGEVSAMKGRHHTKKTKEKMRKAREDKFGEKASNWQGGITPENAKIRQSIEGKLWIQSVFARDGYICQITGQKGGKLVAHHIKNFSQYPELRLAIDNGITLFLDAHNEFHKIYGKRNNTLEQLKDFKELLTKALTDVSDEIERKL